MAYKKHAPYRKSQSFFPDFVLKDAVVIVGYLIIFFAVVFFWPDLLTEPASRIPADPYTTPDHIKPEWYFLAAYQELKILPNETLGLLLQVVVVTLLALLPFLDRGTETRLRKRPIFVIGMVLGIIGMIGLTVWGKLS